MNVLGVKGLSDKEWAELLKDSPRKAYELLVSSFGSLVYAIAYNKLGGCASKEDIDDCVSDIFVEIFRSADRFEQNSGSMKVFVSTIAKRRAIDAFRRLSKRYSVTDSIDEMSDDTEFSGGNAQVEAEDKILQGQLWDTVRSLGEPDSLIIIYQYYYDMTIAQIAKRLDMTPAAVQKRSSRARDKIRSVLEKE